MFFCFFFVSLMGVDCVCHVKKKTCEQWSKESDILIVPLFSCVTLALFAPRVFVARPGQKSPTALHDESSSDKDKDDGINYTTVDWREFMCNTWHLEPTLRSALLHISSSFRCTTFHTTESDLVTVLIQNRQRTKLKRAFVTLCKTYVTLWPHQKNTYRVTHGPNIQGCHA